MKTRPTPYASTLALLAAGTLIGISTAQAQWVNPYAGGSAADLTLRFNNGAAGSATSPSIPFAIGLSVNTTTPGLGTGGGWGLSATGTATFGVGAFIVGETYTRTSTAPNALNFELDTTGVSQIVGLSMQNQWYATSGNIAGSDSWSVTSQSYRYVFDAVLSNDLLSLSPTVFNDFTLTIQAGSTILYQQTGLSTILPSLAPSVTGASVAFTYDQSDGPLEILWTGSTLVSTSLLGIIGDGDNTIFGVRNGQIQNFDIEAIPEPGTYALLISTGGLLLLLRRRRMSIG